MNKSHFSGINAYGRLILNRVQSISGFALFLLTPRMILMPSLGWCLSIYSISIPLTKDAEQADKVVAAFTLEGRDSVFPLLIVFSDD